jgi:hypothetical protein
MYLEGKELKFVGQGGRLRTKPTLVLLYNIGLGIEIGNREGLNYEPEKGKN